MLIAEKLARGILITSKSFISRIPGSSPGTTFTLFAFFLTFLNSPRSFMYAQKPPGFGADAFCALTPTYDKRELRGNFLSERGISSKD